MPPSSESASSQSSRTRAKSLAKSPEQPAPSKTLLQCAADDKPAFSPVLRKIPRPPNAFILYRSAKMREIAKSDKNLPTGTGLGKLDYQRQLSKQIGQLWRNESAEVKAAFYDKSKQAAREHAQRYPEYRFKPAKKDANAGDEPSTSSTPAESVANTSSHSRTNSDDFSPVSGPVSGSGSGSGRKRASLESARSKASPYSASRHRRSSSANSSSPARRRSIVPVTHGDEQSPPLHADPVALSQPASSFVYASEEQDQYTTHRTSARHAPTHSSSQTSFDTLLPDHLRERPRVFLAPFNNPTAPPIPVGRAITTNEAVSTFCPKFKASPQRDRPKIGLAEAVKRALPPERRALLHASLIRKGLIPVSDEDDSSSIQGQPCLPHTSEQTTPGQSASQESTPSLVQTESWSSIANSSLEMDRSHPWHAHNSTRDSFLPGTNAASTTNLLPALDPALQDSIPMQPTQGPSINISMRASDAAQYQELSVWDQPEQVWSENSWTWACPADSSTMHPSQGPVAVDFDVIDSTTSQDAHVAVSNTGPEQQAPAGVAFSHIDFGNYNPAEAISELDRAINAANSVIVALSQQSQEGEVHGHMYGLDGELIGQGTVNPLAAEPASGLSSDEESQQRAVELLLQQMMGATTPYPHGSQSQPYTTDASQSFGSSQSQSFHEAQQWPEWQQAVSSATPSGAVINTAASQSDVASAGSSAPSSPSHSQQSSHTRPDDAAPAYLASSTSVEHAYSNAGEPSEAHHRLDQGVAWAALHDNAQFQHDQENGPAELPPSTPSVSRGLRSWKAAQLSSIKDKFARIRQRSTSTPPVASVSLL